MENNKGIAPDWKFFRYCPFAAHRRRATSDVQTVQPNCSAKAVWSFCRFLHFATTNGRRNSPSERSKVVDA